MPGRTTNHVVQPMNYHVASVVDGSPISIREWLPPPEVATKAVVQVTHGISEHSGRYDRFARHLAENGYRGYAIDLRDTAFPSRRRNSGERASIFGRKRRPT